DILLNKDVDIDDLLASEDPKDRDNGFFTFGKPRARFKVIRGFESFAALDMLFFARPNIISRVFAHLPNIKDIIKPGQIHRYTPEYELIKSIQNLGIIPYVINFSEYQFGLDWGFLRPAHIQIPAEDTLVQTQNYFIKFCRKLFLLVKKIIKAFVPYALLWLYRKLKGRL
ncbi:MAG: hypothetical protein LBC77_06485, partial [Spirochaetaceae bacterium]|nr:hypothetical protein [Spirochaetaceae bacterium]